MAPRLTVGGIVGAPRGLWLGGSALLLALAALSAGWWLGQRGFGMAGADRSEQEALKQVNLLQEDLSSGKATASQQQRLLELLLALQKNAEATALLERMADQQPDRWPLRLMLAELRRDQNDRKGAEREVRQLLNIKPDRIEALQLMALLQFEQGRGEQAQSQLEAAHKAASKSTQQAEPAQQAKALQVGLLLADLLQRRGKQQEADQLYRKLAKDHPNSMEPSLALALLSHERGQTQAALNLLAEARKRLPDPQDPRLDQVAASWGLAPLREAANGQAPRAPSPLPIQGSGAPLAPGPPAP
ncbi:tetratricopeptide repeat protein [Synechococcus sp. CS-602]|uniref:tetratricopeptide repeat protein n=1 Tax=Synechococcaceae TaxID=1890426 RepID=UPI0008FF2838|nr:MULTISPECIES: tetratricopeptide repeat protein [Synechococcaceae]MCT4365803.1 tetratricopeptide repeat protein [Candidatus Regnicoccus frigidus MAG-AL1]APD49057.1 hypothetical protein BM449_13430 [Synechococcus sp. SynAce01]MCT0201010.1 tetratricopeptide repeat protein [Synechococcus sp. CS-603]MCT0205567.1 tetratricopeptide repeat protein [Synechococcus sp. CS-602]MCT0246896.1 tetratricopeptide repeat protein [Synechococcus sp. CS-601]